MTSDEKEVSAVARLPAWERVLAVVAHPDDESFGIGAVLGQFAAAGAAVRVLCLTSGEASTLGANDHSPADLRRLRAGELDEAAEVLGLSSTVLLDLPDGGLAHLPEGRLRTIVADQVADFSPDGIVVFDPRDGVTGHPDHRAASLAAIMGAPDIPMLGWALPESVAAALREETGAPFSGYPGPQVDLVLTVSRTRQYEAIECHRSQAVPGSVLWRRLELLGDREHLRWLRAGTPEATRLGYDAR